MPAEPDTRIGRERHFADDLVKSIHDNFDHPEPWSRITNPRTGSSSHRSRPLRELGLDLGALARFLEAQPFIFAAYTELEVARAAALVR